MLAAFVAAAPARALSARDSSALRIPRVDEAPSLEWFVGEESRRKHVRGARVDGFRQRKPGDGTPVSRSTTAFMSYDQDRLYVVFVCEDDPLAVRANVARREDISGDDTVGLYLDTFHDRERAYLFMVNPLGIQLDGMVTEGQSWDYTFDALWESVGRLTPHGYVVRMAIPFRSLRFPRQPEQTWGVALTRLIRRNNEEATWPHLTQRVKGFIPQFGALAGLQNISRGRSAELIPYGVLARARVLDEDAAALRTEGEQRVGLDAKLVLRDALTVDATLNPDFSQVESDDPQVTVNERFEVFFPEKRPFFLENAGLFQTPINLFFSRRIVDPGLGARLTGKLDRWALGAIAMNDRAPGGRPLGDPLAGRQAGVGVLRLQRELGDESTVGVLLSDRELAGSFDRAFALDTRWKLSRNWVASAQVVRSSTRRFEGAGSVGTGMLAQIDRGGRRLECGLRYLGLSPGFRAPLGFVPRVGFHEVQQECGYAWRPDRPPLLSFGPRVGTLFNWDWTGNLQDRELVGAFAVELPGETEIELSRVEAFERFKGLDFRPNRTELALTTKRLKWLTVKSAFARGAAVNHDPAPGLPPFLGQATEVEIDLTLRPMPRLRLDQAFLVSRLGRGSARVFTEKRWRTKLSYQLTRFLSLRAIIDHEAVEPNAALTDEEHKRAWSADILLTYLLNPGTAIYLGYVDRYENLGFAAGDPPGLWRTASADTAVGRQFFAKVSYLFRF